MVKKKSSAQCSAAGKALAACRLRLGLQREAYLPTATQPVQSMIKSANAISGTPIAANVTKRCGVAAYTALFIVIRVPVYGSCCQDGSRWAI